MVARIKMSNAATCMGNLMLQNRQSSRASYPLRPSSEPVWQVECVLSHIN